jgi:transposase
MRDVRGVVYDDASVAVLFSTRGRTAEAPWRLALITVMPFAEGLPDRQAAEAVRARIDWQDAFGLELDDPGSTCPPAHDRVQRDLPPPRWS